MAENKLYITGRFSNGKGLIGNDFYVADAETKCLENDCDKQCVWPRCSRDWTLFHRETSLKSRVEYLKRLGHTVKEAEDGTE